MLNKIIHFLLIILFITLPLINSHLLDFFGLAEIAKNFYVDWNYEFSKVIFFNIFSGLILFLYFLWTIIWIHPLSGTSFEKGRNIFIPKIIFPIIFILLISTIFSISPEISLFWNTDKAHSFLMFLNLIWIYLIIQNSEYSFKKSLLFWSVLWLFPVIYFAWWEFFNPSYNYWDLGNRAFGTFGHPNYLALYLLLFLPIITQNKVKLNRNLNYFLIIWIVSAILLTKSVLAISLLILYKSYYFLFKARFKHIKTLYFIVALIWILFIIIQNFWYSKLHSFISRFYIWETTWNIISSDIKTFFIWNGTETLWIIFDSFKSPYLYIFENFWFTADRPHNIFLNLFYHFWIFWFLMFLYLILKLIFKKYWVYKHSLVLALIFLCFNYASISSYLIIVLIISLINKNTNKTSILNSFSFSGERGYILYILTIFLITIFSIFWWYHSYKLYNSEILIYKENYIEAKNNYIFWEKIYKIDTCEELIEKWDKSVETYFYCWNIKYNKNSPEAWIKYYKLWLEKLPDLWNKNSQYFNNILIKDNPDILHRFYARKYSNLEVILKRVWIKK
jgi:hypothetical protein